MKVFKSLKINKTPAFDETLIRTFGDSITLGAFLKKWHLLKLLQFLNLEKKQTINELHNNIGFAVFFKDTREDYV